MSLNKVMLIGNVGKDPEIRYIDNGVCTATMSLATTTPGYTLQNGTQVPERTEWHRIVLWRKLAEIVERYVHKGEKIYIEGQLRTYPFGVTLMTALSTILPLIIIFGYKNRKRQINHVNLAMLLAVAWYAVCAAYCFAAASRTGFEVAPSYGLVFPALSLLALYLAKRGIKHDEALVRAADRIR